MINSNPFCTFKINCYLDRQALITALVNSGYKVWAEEKQKEGKYRQDTNYYVHVEQAPKGGKDGLS